MAQPLVDDPATRPGEADDAYVFVDRDAFEAQSPPAGSSSGPSSSATSTAPPCAEPPEGRDIVLEIDVQGAEQVVASYPKRC